MSELVVGSCMKSQKVGSVFYFPLFFFKSGKATRSPHLSKPRPSLPSCPAETSSVSPRPAAGKQSLSCFLCFDTLWTRGLWRTERDPSVRTCFVNNVPQFQTVLFKTKHHVLNENSWTSQTCHKLTFVSLSQLLS